MKCGVCSRNQHAICYGYLGKCPPTHACYSCLLGDDIDRLGKMQARCIYRRVLDYFTKNDTVSTNDLFHFMGVFYYACIALKLTSLGIEDASTEVILENLEELGFIEVAMEGKGKRRAEKLERKYRLASKDKFGEIYYPADGIEHLVNRYPLEMYSERG
jgi:hypothetical protein